MRKFTKSFEFAKVDADLGLVMGWGIVCTENGEPYFDLTKTDSTDGDHIPDDVMLEIATDFMLHSRVAKEMHAGDAKGAVAHSFPLTAEVAKAFGIECERTGWMVAVKFEDDDVLQKFQDGTYAGFSIGGFLTDWEEIEA